MLTLEEARWALNAFKIYSLLNISPVQVDPKNGRIGRQSNRVKVFVWKILFGIGISQALYVFGRLVQSTTLEKEKYFSWDHFVLHFGCTCGYVVFYFVGFRLFVTNSEENVIIFNHLFEQRADPVQKMMDQQPQVEMASGKGKRGKTRAKSGTRILAMSIVEGNEQGQIQSQAFEEPSESEVCPRPLLTWPPQYSLDELIAKLTPLATTFTGFSTILIFAIDPSRPQLLYSSLPPEWQNIWSFLLLLAPETLCLANLAFSGSFSIVTQVMLFGKCQLEFKRMSLQLRNLREKFQNRSLGAGTGNRNEDRDIRREIWILRQISKDMRELVVLIELFNRCFPFCIFAWKMCSLSVCILFYFFGIRHFENIPLLAVFAAYVAIAVNSIYTIMYTHAFSIPRKMDDLKNEFLLTVQKTTSTSTSNPIRNQSFWLEMKKEMKRIRGVAIKVGSFNQMERESTPKFIDFVFNQVVSLLVTFPR